MAAALSFDRRLQRERIGEVEGSRGAWSPWPWTSHSSARTGLSSRSASTGWLCSWTS